MVDTTGAATTASISGAAATTTFSFVSDGSPLYVIVPCWMSTGTLNSVTFNGVALTRIAQSALSHIQDRVEIWRLLAPAATTANIVLTYSAATGHSGTVGAYQTSGQDTTTPEGTAATKASTVSGTSTGSLAISGAASDDLVIWGIADSDGFAITPTATGGGTAAELFDLASSGEESEAGTAAGTVTALSATLAGTTGYAMAAIPLKALTSTTLVSTGVDSEEALGSASLAQDSVQTAGPVSDVAAGAWTPSTGVDLFAMVDEPAIDDTDWIVSSVNPQADLAELALGPLTDPASSDGHVIQYRIRLVS
jgi:hypothetical protein